MHGNQTRFHGNINEDMTLTDIFQNLGSNQQHGWLYLKATTKELCLYFQGDLVALVTPPQEKLAYIPARLYHAGKIHQQQYEEIIAQEDPLSMLEQQIDDEEITELLNTICYEEICNAFTIVNGIFEFVSHNDPEADREQTPIGRFFEVEGVLMEIVQRQHEQAELFQVIPSAEEILVQNMEPDFAYGPDDPVGNLWLLADQRSVNEMLALSYYSEFDAMRILSTLLQEGQLRLITDEELHNIAIEQENAENWQQACDYYRLLLQRNPSNANICNSLAQCYEHIENKEALGQLYKDMADRYLSSHNAQDQMQGGIFLKRFCDLFPETNEGIEARTNLFYATINQQLDAKSIEYNIIIEGKKLFQSLRYRKNDVDARQVLQSLLAISPHDKSLQSQLINVCLDLNDVGSAIGQYEGMIKIYERDKDWQELVATYQKIVKLDPQRKDIQKKLELAEAKLKRGSGILTKLIALFLLAGLGGGGWFAYQKYIKKPVKPINGTKNIKTPEQLLAEKQKNIDKAAQIALERIKKNGNCAKI